MRLPDPMTVEELGRAFGAAIGVLLAVYLLASLVLSIAGAVGR